MADALILGTLFALVVLGTVPARLRARADR
jgi:hypothetical protein